MLGTIVDKSSAVTFTDKEDRGSSETAKAQSIYDDVEIVKIDPLRMGCREKAIMEHFFKIVKTMQYFQKGIHYFFPDDAPYLLDNGKKAGVCLTQNIIIRKSTSPKHLDARRFQLFGGNVLAGEGATALVHRSSGVIKILSNGSIVLSAKKDRVCKEFHEETNNEEILFEYNFLQKAYGHQIKLGEGKNGKLAIIMPNFGRNLIDAIKEEKIDCSDTASLLDIAKQAILALQQIHFLGIQHNDVKPENIFIDDSRIVRILDFGFSIAIGDEDNVGGSLIEVAPEKRNGTRTFASDIYSLGVSLLAMFTLGKTYEQMEATEKQCFFQLLQGKGTQEVAEYITELGINQTMFQCSLEDQSKIVNILAQMLDFRPECRPSLPSVALVFEQAKIKIEREAGIEVKI